MLVMPAMLQAQQLRGVVFNAAAEPLQGASVKWMGTNKGTVSGDKGAFSILLPAKLPATLLVSFTGYATDSIIVDNDQFLSITLREKNQLEKVTVRSPGRAAYLANTPVKAEVITSLELKKAACCDLAGCFETQATVQPQTTNIITNSKELRILGLSGIYNQVLIDGFPQIQGLTYTYGISSIPGTLVENIWVAKGANSVLQGYESISGQINVITKEPGNADKLLLNAYINSFAEKHLNAVVAFKKNKWANLTAFHMVQPANRIDRDDDNFMDLPLLTRYMISTRWKKGDEAKWGWATQVAVRYLSEKRIGGQVDFNYKEDKGSTNSYGQAVDIQQPELWFKTAYRLNEVHRFAFYTSGFRQEQQSYFGVTNYKASQTNLYANLQYEFSYAGNSVLKAGLSYRHLNLSENIAFFDNSLQRTYDGLYRNQENIPGLFVENTWNSDSGKITLITGLRADHHNRFGWMVTPRALLKYQATDKLILRASVGRGWRTANIFPENIGMLVSSRDIIFAGPLQPEKALNFGFNATQKFRASDLEGYLSLDFYRTQFSNQVFPDYDSDPAKAIIRNFTGTSVSNGFQAELSGTFYQKLSMKAGYVLLDVYQQRNGAKEVLPFNPRHRFNAAASFMPLSRKWHTDINMHWYGQQRLPDTKNNPAIYQMPGQSDAYTVVNAQFTYKLRQLDLYGGIENIFNFRQRKPLIGWQDPFGQYFDTQFAWGPTRGREMYMGVRFMVR